MNFPDRSKIQLAIDQFEQACRHNVIAVDLETTSLRLAIADITWLSWSISDVDYGAVAIQHRNPVSTIDVDRLKSIVRELHFDPGKTVVYHNAAFDLGVLISRGWLREEEIQCKIFDTMRASYILDPVKAKEGGKHSLKVLYDELLRGERGPRQPNFDSTTDGYDFQDVPLAEASYYAAFDAWSTLQLFLMLSDQLQNDRYFWDLEMPSVFTTIELNRSGLTVLTPNEAKARNLDLEHEIGRSLVEVETAIRRLTGIAVKLSSSKQIARLLFRLNIQVAEKVKRGRMKTSKGALAGAYRRERSPEGRKLLSYLIKAKVLMEQAKKQREVYQSVVPSTGKIYPSFNPSTVTGRYTATKPNVLSMGSSTGIKKFIVPAPGHVFVVADFSQIDLRIIANETGTKSRMLADVNRGVDLHLNTVRILYPDKVDPRWKSMDDVPDANKDEIATIRKDLAKPVNFGISYGLGVQSLARSLSEPKEYTRDIGAKGLAGDVPPPKIYTPEEVDSFLDSFHSEYREIRSFQASVEQDLIHNRVTKNIFGRNCRVGVLGHLGSTRMVIEVKGNWYEMEASCVNLDASFVNVVVHRLTRLHLLTKNPDQVDPSKWQFGAALDVRRNGVDLITSSPLYDLWWDLKIGKDVARLPHRWIRYVYHSRRKNQRLRYFGFKKMRREMISYRIQSASMDVCRIAMMEFRKRARVSWPNDPPRLVNCIHDEIAVECRESIAEEVQTLLQGVMRDGSIYAPYVRSGAELLVNIDATAEIKRSNYAE